MHVPTQFVNAWLYRLVIWWHKQNFRVVLSSHAFLYSRSCFREVVKAAPRGKGCSEPVISYYYQQIQKIIYFTVKM